MIAGQYYCWGCGLMFGDADAPVLPSQLCASCKRNQASVGGSRRAPYGEASPTDDDATGAK